MLDNNDEEAIESAEDAAKRRILAAKATEVRASNAARYRMNEAQWLRDSRMGGQKTTLGGRAYLEMKVKQEAKVRSIVKVALATAVLAALFFLFRH